VTFDAHFLTSVLSIVLIDITLAGDNAVVIAMAARTLPRDKRRKAIFFGAGAAVLVRVTFTFFVAQLLGVQFVKLVGGLVILWVAAKLFLAEGPEKKEGSREAHNIWEAVKIIVIADISMGVDNMLAVGGASGGHLSLLIFGLGLSIPFVVFASDLLSRLMDRYPVILYIGAAILGRVAGNMIMTDPTTAAILKPAPAAVYAVEAVLALAIIAFGWAMRRRASRQRAGQAAAVERTAA
jgi:YjbE family integral membrane protein